MNWYMAKLVYRIICGRGTHTPQFEEQLRLIVAASKDEAYRKAKAIALREEVQFPNEKQELVRWKFINISDLYQLSEVVDGTEIYSRIEEKNEDERFEDLVHARARFLQDELNTPHLQQI
jgi:hypothetical protein